MTAVFTHQSVEPRKSRIHAWLPPALVYLAIALLTQWIGGAYTADFDGYPDEPAHYVTGLMVHDYVTHLFPASPLRYASNYYLHYPEVAIGHWPPFFYILQSCWTLLFPISHSSMLVFMALLAAACASLIHRFAEQHVSIWTAWFAGLAFLTVPAIQQSYAMVMAEVPLILLSLAAVMAIIRLVEVPTNAGAVLAGVLIAATMMTKPSGFALALCVPLTLLLMGQWRAFLSPRWWIAGAVAAVLALPFYAVAWTMTRAGQEDRSIGVEQILSTFAGYLADFPASLGWPVTLLLVLGLVTIGLSLWRRPTASPFWVVMGALLLSILLFHSIVPATVEARKNTLATPAALLFAAAGIEWITQRFRSHQALVPAIALVAFLLLGFRIQHREPALMPDVARILLSSAEISHGAILVSASSVGAEGALVAAIAAREPDRPRAYVLRGSKQLASVTWNGLHYRTRFPSPEQVQAALDSIPVRLLVIESNTSVAPPPHEAQLRDIVSATDAGWRPIYSSRSVSGARKVEVYERTATPTGQPIRFEVDLSDKLGRQLKTGD